MTDPTADHAAIIAAIGRVFTELDVRNFHVARTDTGRVHVSVYRTEDVARVREHAMLIHTRTADLGCTMHVSVDKRTPETIYVRSKRYPPAVIGPYEAYLTP